MPAKGGPLNRLAGRRLEDQVVCRSRAAILSSPWKQVRLTACFQRQPTRRLMQVEGLRLPRSGLPFGKVACLVDVTSDVGTSSK
jgi:hypothetical protein